MGKSADAPESPDPRVTIPLQGQENRRTFDYQLAGMRTNTAGPTGSQTWSRVPQFDEAAYNQAMQQYQTQQGSQPAGHWQETPGLLFDDTPTRTWVEGGGDGDGRYAIAPSRDQFMTDQWTLNTTLSPEQQALYDANVGSQLGQANLLSSLTGRVADATANPMDWSQIPALSGAVSPEGINQEQADAIYRLNTRYLDPQMADTERSLQSRLADQGFVPGTPAYAAEMDRLSQGRERAYADARDRATSQGLNAGNMAFNQRLAGAQQGNATRTQAISEALLRRNQPLNELNAMRTGTQVQMPTGQTSSPTPNLSPVDITGAYQQDYLNQLGGYNAEVASGNGLFDNLLGLGGLFMGGGGLSGLLAGLGGGGSGNPLYSLPTTGVRFGR